MSIERDFDGRGQDRRPRRGPAGSRRATQPPPRIPHPPGPVISDGIGAAQVEDALRLSYDAFSAKLRFGFRGADDLVRFFADSVDGTSCLSAAANGSLAGFLALKTAEREFYHVNAAAFARFRPLRAVRILINLSLLAIDNRVGADEFIVDSVAVAHSSRGLGVGTALMRAAETTAGRMGKRVMSLGVIGGKRGRDPAV